MRRGRRAADRVADRVAQRLDARHERAERHALLLRSHLVDPAWVGRQLGLAPGSLPGVESAVDALLDADETDGAVSPHPLVELAWARPGEPWRNDGSVSLEWFLRSRNRRETQSTHPLIDVEAIVRAEPAARTHPGGPLGHWLEHADPTSVVPTHEGLPPVTLGALVEAAGSALVEHQALVRTCTRSGPAPSLRPGLEPTTAPAVGAGPAVSVILVTHDAATDLADVVRGLQRQSLDSWELVVADAGSTDDTPAVLEGLAHFEPRVRWVRLDAVDDQASETEALDVAVGAARGRHLVGWSVDGGRGREFLSRLVAALDAGPDVVLAWPERGTGPAPRDLAELLAGPPVPAASLAARRASVVASGGLDASLRAEAVRDLVARLVGPGPLASVRLPLSWPDRRPDEPGDWESALLARHLVDWTSTEESTGQADGEIDGEGEPTTSVVAVAGDEVVRTASWLRVFLSEATPGVDLTVVGARPSRTHHVVAAMMAALSPSTRCRFTAVRMGAAAAADLGLATAPGRRVVVARTDAEPLLADLVRLADAAERPGVAVAQPLVVGRDGLVASAGATFATTAPRPEALLAGHAVRDARTSDGDVPVAAPLSPVVAMTRATARALRGLDPAYGSGLPEVELGLRAAAAGLGGTVLVSDVTVTCSPGRVVGPGRLVETIALLEGSGVQVEPDPATWSRFDLEVVGVADQPLRDVSDAADPAVADPVHLPRVTVRAAPPVAVRVTETPPRLRWTLDTAVPAGSGGESWGDLHFARSLADALERRGQQVAVDRREARHRSSRALDDVVLTLRGLDRVPSRPGAVRLLWVISHPELVDRAEVAGYAATYAASISWATDATARWSLPVTPLLQATDPGRFHPGPADVDATGPVLFVGNSRGVFRTSLRAALAAGVDVEVHGKGWREHLRPDQLASTGIANADLGRAYGRAAVVLNDHWDDMRRLGFLSNRLFDAGACGARILTDPVDGVEDVFGPLARVYHDEAEAAEILADPDAAFADRDERLARAAVIAAEHSFDRRAETLLDDAVRLVRAGL